jgi:G3E family GTPase
MIPLVTITGFLGSGKTTFLKRIIKDNPERKLAFLVNEFGAADVDGHVLAASTEHVATLPGGSIFCRCLVASFIKQMNQIAEQWNHPQAPLEGVIVEASGIADPGVLPQMLEETGLSARYRPVQVISLVDPGTFSQLLQTLPSIAAQVRASTTAIINKTDLYDQALIQRTEKSLHELNPSIRAIRAVHARTELSGYEALFGFGPDLLATGTYALCRDPRYASTTLENARPVDLKQLSKTLQSFGGDLYRAKGVVWTGRNHYYLNAVAGRVRVDATEAQPRCTRIVLIFNPGIQNAVKKKLNAFTPEPNAPRANP